MLAGTKVVLLRSPKRHWWGGSLTPQRRTSSFVPAETKVTLLVNRPVVGGAKLSHHSSTEHQALCQQRRRLPYWRTDQLSVVRNSHTIAGEKKSSTTNSDMVFSCFYTASETWATVSGTTSNSRFISSETLKPPRAMNSYGPSLARQRSAACLTFAFTPAVTVACCIAFSVADAMLWALPPASWRAACCGWCAAGACWYCWS